MKTLPLILALALTTPATAAQKKTAAPEPLVEFEMMTWPEVKKAIEGGKTVALVYNGGTEQRGPQSVNGGHTLMGRATVKAIASVSGTPSPLRCCLSRRTGRARSCPAPSGSAPRCSRR